MITVARYTGTSLVDVERIPIERFLRLASRVVHMMERDAYERWLVAAFTGWQIVSALGAKASLRDYVRKLGLKEPHRG